MKRKTAFLAFASAFIMVVGCNTDNNPTECMTVKSYCDYYGNGTKNYTVTLEYGKRTSSGLFKGEASSITLDIIAPASCDSSRVPEGVFNYDPTAAITEYTILPSEAYTLREYYQMWAAAGFLVDTTGYTKEELDAPAGYYGSYYYCQTNGKDGDYYPIEDATATITRYNGGVNVSVKIKVSGQEKEFAYNGPAELTIEDSSERIRPGIYAKYYGDYYENDTDNWNLNIFLEDYTALYMEIQAEHTANFSKIPTGTYTVTEKTAVGSILYGYMDDVSGFVYGSCVGTWNGSVNILVEEGTITITPQGNEYKVDYDLTGRSTDFGGHKVGSAVCTVHSIKDESATKSTIKIERNGMQKTLPKATGKNACRRVQRPGRVLWY